MNESSYTNSYDYSYILINPKKNIVGGKRIFEIYSKDNIKLYESDSEYGIMIMLDILNLTFENKEHIKYVSKKEQLEGYGMIINLVKKDQDENN